LEVNLTDEKSVEKAVKSTIEKFGRIDTLVNNAGFGQTGTIEEVTDQEARRNFDVNVFGLLNVQRAVLPHMRQQRSGHIYNISSIAGFVSSFSGWGIYCTTKFAVSGITEALHADVKDLGIKVTLVYPGYFRTNFLESDSMMKTSRSIDDYVEAHQSIDLHSSSIRGNQPGDPAKLAKILIDHANKKDAPLHLFLGADAYELAQAKLKSLAAEIEAMKKVSVSTGIDS
jgi:NAD(P)-dependent dehydrogenase (short-subunit alcohol dehydrogenase family)